ncbi:4'-phosphopantetheinyl transferase family protein [Streptomyces sp. AC154]|uniref:4'-phosphopantetheinyl transferase family protein n=1 Tax=Streptomyces sp. AC154 TaxID=3143184 RepID=UPI003F7F0B35
MNAPPHVLLRTLSLPAPGEASAPLAHSCLDDGERARAAGFVGTRARLRYVTAHVALRHVLAEYTGTEPALLRFGRERISGHMEGRPRGRPVLLGLPARPHFSLSHSHDLIMIAVADVPVGLDVQRVPPPGTVDALLPRLHPDESEGLLGVPPAGRTVAFTRLWTRKEAYLKGLGTGLARGTATDCLLEGARTPPPAGWYVRDVPVPSGYAAATSARHPVSPKP